MTHKLDADDLFIHRVQAHCAEARLNFFLVEPVWAHRFLESVESGAVRVRALLNMHSEHHDPADLFSRIVQATHRSGAMVIDPPDLARTCFNKALMHSRLLEAGLQVPPTIVVSQTDIPNFKLTDPQRELLGSPFIVKPALGYGRKGLVLDARDESALISSARAFPNSHFLLQRRIEPATHEGQPFYLRGYHVFGEFHFCWWNFNTDRYRAVTEVDMDRLSMREPLMHILKTLAALTGMKFFSTEIARTPDNRFVVIDYINDQCHMLSQGADPARGVPDTLVEAVARGLVTGVARHLKNTP